MDLSRPALVLLLTENVSYITIIRYYHYKSSMSKHYAKRFRLYNLYQLYDRLFINSIPSKKRRDFCLLHNKLTITFALFIIATFLLFVYSNIMHGSLI